MTESQERAIMKESSYYQGILEEGKAKGSLETVQSFLLDVGTNRFGAPSPADLAALNRIQDVAALRALATRALDVNSWQELVCAK